MISMFSVRLSFALLSNFLLASAALARRYHGHRQFHDRASNSTNYDVFQSENWAGIALNGQNFTRVDGTFTVPVPNGRGTSASVWVGIDGYPCETALLQTGVNLIRDNNDVVEYLAWYEWYPAYSVELPAFIISAGDRIRLSVGRFTPTLGAIYMKNVNTGQIAFEYLESENALCGQSAEWIVEDYLENHQLVPFTDFGSVTFTDIAFTNNFSYGAYNLLDANVWDIVQDGGLVTSASTDGTSITITYL